MPPLSSLGKASPPPSSLPPSPTETASACPDLMGAAEFCWLQLPRHCLIAGQHHVPRSSFVCQPEGFCVSSIKRRQSASSTAWYGVQRSDVTCTWTPLGPVTLAEGASNAVALVSLHSISVLGPLNVERLSHRWLLCSNTHVYRGVQTLKLELCEMVHVQERMEKTCSGEVSSGGLMACDREAKSLAILALHYTISCCCF
ncbi:uncharacterized protein LOC111922856 isoform X2 [Cyanistes caeruleus]|uniref:uncharacterized protein LOC111922856 isoform X2 n=1 Tax=Cyanistes caeruleus TaxID=156563 RepID=UPI000CDB1521|nr:uncharacterized protein LOC111922856 isoform X2 [Cyanistes caeruleus]